MSKHTTKPSPELSKSMSILLDGSPIEETYEIVYSFPLEVLTSDAIPSVGEVLDRINAAMSSFGFEEKLFLRSTIGYTNLVSSKRLPEDELMKIKSMIQNVLDDKSPNLAIHVGDPASPTVRVKKKQAST